MSLSNYLEGAWARTRCAAGSRTACDVDAKRDGSDTTILMPGPLTDAASQICTEQGGPSWRSSLAILAPTTPGPADL